MTVESFILIRAEGDGTEGSPFGPREADLAPYSLAWEDISARASWTDDGTLFLNSQLTEPRVMVIKGRMSNPDAVTMQGDNKVWMLASRRYDNTTGELVDSNYQDPYDAGERTTRITQLSNFTDFDYQQIENWWTPDKTHRQVAEKLWDYLGKINKPE